MRWAWPTPPGYRDDAGSFSLFLIKQPTAGRLNSSPVSEFRGLLEFCTLTEDEYFLL